MYKALEIHSFRGFHELSLDDLERVNLIAGANNVGKTALLEAIFLHCGASNPLLTVSIERLRGFDEPNFELGNSGRTPWDPLFYMFHLKNCIKISGRFSDGSSRSIRLKIVRPTDEAFEGLSIPYTLQKSEKRPIAPESTLLLCLDYEEQPLDKSGLQPKFGRSCLVVDPEGMRITTMRAPPFPTIFLAAKQRISTQEDAERFGKLEIMGEQDLLLDALKIVEPRLRRLAVVAIGGLPMIYGDIGLDRMLALAHMGDGLTRLSSILLAIGNAKNGVVLIDEIENGFHHSSMEMVWTSIATAARRSNVQIFATTHSLECIFSAHKAFSKGTPYDMRVHRLDREDDLVKAVTFGQDDLDAVLEFRMDVR
ncbi:MAG: AAA family ATPase [Methanotrichaceae archaeon]|nr:AAA family ATPase [Methanotrichaceae archaeon]